MLPCPALPRILERDSHKHSLCRGQPRGHRAFRLHTAADGVHEGPCCRRAHPPGRRGVGPHPLRCRPPRQSLRKRSCALQVPPSLPAAAPATVHCAPVSPSPIPRRSGKARHRVMNAEQGCAACSAYGTGGGGYEGKRRNLKWASHCCFSIRNFIFPQRKIILVLGWGMVWPGGGVPPDHSPPPPRRLVDKHIPDAELSEGCHRAIRC